MRLATRGFYLAAATAGLIAAQPAHAGYTPEVEPNDTQATAQNLNPYFDLTSDPNVYNSTLFRHADVNGTGPPTTGADWFSFTVSSTGMVGIFDIDGASPTFDAALGLYDSGGQLLAYGDDSTLDPGSNANGFNFTFDPYLTYHFTAPGVYSLRVTNLNGPAATLAPGSYQLHVSLGLPEPGTWAMMLFGFGAIGFALRRHRSLATA